MAETFSAQCQCPKCGRWMNGLGVNSHYRNCSGKWEGSWVKPDEEAQKLFRQALTEENK